MRTCLSQLSVYTACTGAHLCMISYSITLSLFLSSNTYQKASFAPLGTMSFARLPQCQVYEIFVCLGPDYYHLRGACLLTREKSNSIDLPLEILRWHCANSDLLDQKLPCFEVLGRIPLRCSRCEVRARTRQMYRYNRAISDGNREGMLYLCWNCALEEARLFLTFFSLTGKASSFFLPNSTRGIATVASSPAHSSPPPLPPPPFAI